MFKVSNFISTVLLFGLFPVMIYGVFSTAAQVSKKEITIAASDGKYYLGRPGIDMTFRRHNTLEMIAPDNTGNSSITVIRDNFENYYRDDSTTTYHSGNERMAKAFSQQQTFPKIAEEGEATQLLRVQPGTTRQHLYFIFYDIIWFGSIIALVYLGMRLFTNLSRRDFNNKANARLFRYAGIFFILPQLLKLLTYNLYGNDFNPVKAIIAGGNYNIVAQFTCIADLNFILISVGVLLILLTYAFKWIKLVNEDNSLMV